MPGLSGRAAVERRIKANPVEGTPQERRAAFERLIGPGPRGPSLSLGGVTCVAHGTGPDALWFHGGGYMFGSPESHARAAARLANLSGHRIILPQYKRAPEYPWPAPLEDAQAVVAALAPGVPLIGDSAGGHLALNACISGRARPRCLALISPNTDRTGASKTRIANSDTDLMNDHAVDAELARIAFGDRPGTDPVLSPHLADLATLPPTYLTASRSEVLAGDTSLFCDAAEKVGRPITVVWQKDLFHLWPLWPDALPEAEQTLREIAAFLVAHSSA